MSDILLAYHPIMIAREIRNALNRGGISHEDAAKRLEVSTRCLTELLTVARLLTPEIAARLHRVGIDNGRSLYLAQEERRFEIQRRYEAGEIEKPQDFVEAPA